MLEIELHKRLRYSWRGGSLDTVVTWTLTQTPSGGTLLQLEQSGLRPADAQAMDGSAKGWQRMGASLRSVLEQGA